MESILYTQRQRAIKLAELNHRKLQSRPIYGRDLRDLVTLYHRATEKTEERVGQYWDQFTKPVSHMVPTFAEACHRWETPVSMFTVLVSKAKPRGFLAESEDREVRTCVQQYESM